MKKISLFLGAFFVLGMSSAHAGQQVRLGDIDTNNCQNAYNEIMLLNSANFPIEAYCDYYGPFGAPNNGQTYSSQLQVYVTLPDNMQPGQAVELSHINTNGAYCQPAYNEVKLLNTNAFSLELNCNMNGPFADPSGRYYNNQLTVMLRMN